MANNCPKCNYEIDTNQNFVCSKCGKNFWQSKEIFEKHLSCQDKENKETLKHLWSVKNSSNKVKKNYSKIALSLLLLSIGLYIVTVFIGSWAQNKHYNLGILQISVFFVAALMFVMAIIFACLGPNYQKVNSEKINETLKLEKFCSKCGKKLERNVHFCSHCGQKLVINKKFPIWGYILIVGMIIIPISLWGFEENKQSTQSSTINSFTCDEQTNINLAKNSTHVIGIFDKKDNFIGYGSGFALKNNQNIGLILTNHHVIENSFKIKVWIGFTEINRWMDVSIYTDYPDQDIALLKVDYIFPYTLELADSGNLKDIDTVYALGWPNEPTGLASITKGILSRRIKEDGVEILQIDAPINPGNSGGPLIYKCGVIGMNTAKMSWSDYQTPSEGTGYALSSNYIKSIILKK